jgi:hypothetical protein
MLYINNVISFRLKDIDKWLKGDFIEIENRGKENLLELIHQ